VLYMCYVCLSVTYKLVTRKRRISTFLLNLDGEGARNRKRC